MSIIIANPDAHTAAVFAQLTPWSAVQATITAGRELL
jgi:hypothetical protein